VRYERVLERSRELRLCSGR